MTDTYMLPITHKARERALSDLDLSIMAALIQCRDLLWRIAEETTYPDNCESEVEEIEEARIAIDKAIAGFVETQIVHWSTIETLVGGNDAIRNIIGD